VVDILLLLLLFAFVPISFFAPISKVHAFMKAEKASMIDPVYEAFELSVRKLASSIRTDPNFRLSRFKKDHDALDVLGSAPEWPYNTAIIKRLVGSWLSVLVVPLLAALISALVEKLKQGP
jgi:hypothetical protein